MMIEPVLASAASALVYSLVFYAKAKASDPDESINFYKLGATLIVGVAVGISYQLAGVDFSQSDISTKLTAYAGTVAIVETLIKTVWRQYLSDYFGSG